MEHTLRSLEALISDQVSESDQLEYKSAGALAKNEKKVLDVTIDISAFANASGGTLIYGIAESAEHPRLPARLDPINAAEISKEWLDQVAGQIRDRIPGLKITPVPTDSSGKMVCYVVQVPKSFTAHQARNHKYYRRRNFESTPMEHYEVVECMSRGQTPRLEIRVMVIKREFPTVLVRVYNLSTVVARFYKVLLYFPIVLPRLHGGVQFVSPFPKKSDVRIDRKSANSVEFIGPHPLFPDDCHDFEVELREYAPGTHPAGELYPNILVRAFADSMNPPFLESFDPLDCLNRWGKGCPPVAPDEAEIVED